MRGLIPETLYTGNVTIESLTGDYKNLGGVRILIAGTSQLQIALGLSMSFLRDCSLNPDQGSVKLKV